MNKFFDYLIYDMPLQKVRELLDYIRRFAAVFAGDMPVEGRMGEYAFCATPLGEDAVRVHWVKIGRELIAVDAVV